MDFGRYQRPLESRIAHDFLKWFPSWYLNLTIKSILKKNGDVYIDFIIQNHIFVQNHINLWLINLEIIS